MIDITEEMLVFKEAIRHIWNTYFAKNNESMSPEVQEAFSNIERALLRVIVLAPHGKGDLADSYRLQVLSNILIKPLSEESELPIRFGHKEQNGNILWDEETTIKLDEVAQLYFFDFFDWNSYGQIDLVFLRARLHLQAVEILGDGQRVLVEQRHCKFMLV